MRPRPGLPLASLLAALAAVGCQACPPAWVESPPEVPGWLHASGAAQEVFVEAEAESLALTRAARRLADLLGLDVERRLSVRVLDGRVFVEALGPDGLLHDLDGLQVVEVARCGTATFALVRLARAP